MLLTGAAVLESDPDDLVDRFYAEGWTDGLPVVLPSERRVAAMLAHAGRDPQERIGLVPPRDSIAKLELVAINAVMAGCEPEHLPVVEAALRAALAPEHNLNGVTCTTHGCVPLVIVSGPQRTRLGFNATDGVFGNGCRANGAVGRALRLLCWNLGGARPGGEDKATMSHPGEWTFCMAEDEERSPWEPLHVERGMAPGSDAVTVFACEAPHSVAAVGSPQLMLHRIASKINARGSNNAEYRYGPGGELLVVINAEQALRLADSGWSKQDVKRWLWERTTRKVREFLDDVDPYSLEIAGRDGLLARGEAWSDWSDRDADVPITPSADDIHVVVAGGNSYFAAVLPGWGWLGGFAVTRPVVRPDRPGELDVHRGQRPAGGAMRVYCPVARTAAHDTGATPDAAGRRGRTVLGVLDDHLDPPFMEELVARLRAGAEGVEVRVWVKPLGTAPAPDDIILEMAEEVRLALVGVGL